MILTRLIFMLSFLLLCNCSVPQLQPLHEPVPSEGQALLTVYLSSSGTASGGGRFILENLAVQKDGVWVELGIAPVQVDGKKSRGQQLLGVALAPTGEHRRIRFQLKDLSIDGLPVAPEGRSEMVELSLAEPLLLESQQSRCLFVDWSLESQRGQGAFARPRFSAWAQRIQLSTGLAYIACRNLATVYLLRTDHNKVVASFAVPGPIGDLQLDSRLRKLYVLSPGNRSIFVYDCIKARLIGQIALPGTVAPEHFVLSADRSNAYVTDAVSSLVLKVDLATGSVLAKQRVGYRPEQIALIPEVPERLAVVAPKAHQISILSAGSLAVQKTFPVGQQVSDLLYTAGSLLVVEQAANIVASYEYQTGRLLARVAVGLKPSELLAVSPQAVYVSNQRGATLSVLVPGQETSFRRIPAGDSPSEMAVSQLRQAIYVLSASQPQLSVVDLPGQFLRKTVPLAGQGTAIVLLD